MSELENEFKAGNAISIGMTDVNFVSISYKYSAAE